VLEHLLLILSFFMEGGVALHEGLMRRCFVIAELTAEPVDDNVYIRISVDALCAF
jgi:hypothetical protein